MILFKPGSSIASLSKVRFTYCSSLPPNQVENVSSRERERERERERVKRRNWKSKRGDNKDMSRARARTKDKSPLKTKDRLCFQRGTNKDENHASMM